MNSIKTSNLHKIAETAIGAAGGLIILLIDLFTQWVERKRDSKLVLATAHPVKAFTDFSALKEAAIESRSIVDTRGRVLAQVKLWTYLDTRQCFREVTFLNPLLRTSVGLSRLSFKPIPVGTGDTPAVLIEVTVREFESWLRHRTPGTQFGIETARAAADKPQPIKVAAIPLVAQPAGPPPNSPAPPRAVIASPVPPVMPAPASRVQASEVRPAPPAVVPPHIKAKVVECSRGILKSFGMSKRTQGERTYEQFCVDITITDGEARGITKRLWGTDLERALSDSRASKGNVVEVLHHGSVPQRNENGGSSYKNMFSMAVVP
jgi:hypothetical protein